MERKGAILLARQIVDSEIWQKPEAWLKIWLYILLKVNHSEGRFTRGENFFRWPEIQEELCGPTRNQWFECITWLKRTTQITTRKTTRGMVIKVNNYNTYQDFKNYKTDTKTDTKTDSKPIQNRHRPDTITNNVNNETNETKIATPYLKAKAWFENPENKKQNQDFHAYWTEPNKSGTKQRWEIQATFDIDRRLATWQRNQDSWNQQHGGKKYETRPQGENWTEKRLAEERRIEEERLKNMDKIIKLEQIKNNSPIK